MVFEQGEKNLPQRPVLSVWYELCLLTSSFSGFAHMSYNTSSLLSTTGHVDFEYHLVVDEAEYMRQMRVQTCTKSYSFTPFIRIVRL